MATLFSHQTGPIPAIITGWSATTHRAFCPVSY
jgi:hypothetical protein